MSRVFSEIGLNGYRILGHDHNQKVVIRTQLRQDPRLHDREASRRRHPETRNSSETNVRASTHGPVTSSPVSASKTAMRRCDKSWTYGYPFLDCDQSSRAVAVTPYRKEICDCKSPFL